MSTNYKQMIDKAKAELKTAKEAGVREQTLDAISKRISKLKRDYKWEKKYRDIKYLKEWPGDILLKRYEQATSFATDREKEIEGVGLFNQKKYKQEKLNVMLPLDFKDRIKKIQRTFKTKFKTYAVYVLLDKSYIANMNKMYGKDGEITEYSYEKRGKSDVKKNKFRTLTFNKSHFFADVKGIVYGRENNLKLKAKPHIEIINGAVKFNLKMSPAKLEKVNIKVIKNLID